MVGAKLGNRNQNVMLLLFAHCALARSIDECACLTLLVLQNAAAASSREDQMQCGSDKSDSEDGDDYDDAHSSVMSFLPLGC